MARRRINAMTATLALTTVLIQPSTASSSLQEEAETCYGVAPTLEGTDGSDVLVGSPASDVIVGGAGADIIISFGGDDRICGGGGADVIISGSGSDAIQGGEGGDLVIGGSGRDSLIGQRGDDVLYASPGRDTLAGGPGFDTLNGGRGHDFGFGQGDDCNSLQGVCRDHCSHAFSLSVGDAEGEGQLLSAQVLEELDYEFEVAVLSETGRLYGYVDRRLVTESTAVLSNYLGLEIVGEVLLTAGEVVGCNSLPDE
jgi:hypothetical protein